MDMLIILYAAAGALMLIGIGGLVLSRHLLRMLFGLTLLEAGVSLLLIIIGYRPDAAAPILLDGIMPAAMVDPLPQALVLTAIVIGLGIQALALALILRLHKAWGSFDMREIRQRMEQAIAEESGTDLPASEHGPQKPAEHMRGIS